MRVGAAVARPGAVICIGQNYAAHAAETGDPPPAQPVIFFKHPNTVVGAFDSVHIPPGATRVDWEVELAVVIGRQARYLASPERRPAASAGTPSRTMCPNGPFKSSSPAASGQKANAARRSTRWDPPSYPPTTCPTRSGSVSAPG